MNKPKVSAGDLFLSLNGFDEIAITSAFDNPVEKLRELPFMFLRAMAYVHMRREGMKDREARKSAMELTVEDLGDYFPPDAVEVDPDDPVTPAGKDT